MGFSQTLLFDFSSANQLISGGDGALITSEKDGKNDVLKIVVAVYLSDLVVIIFEDTIDLSHDSNSTITFKIKFLNGAGIGVHLLKLDLQVLQMQKWLT